MRPGRQEALGRRRRALIAGVAALFLADPAAAQLVGGGLPLPSPGLPSASLPSSRLPETPRVRLPRVRETVDTVRSLGAETLANARRLKLEALVREHPDLLEVDDAGAPVVRGEVLAIAPRPEALDRLKAAGFAVKGREDLGALGLELAVISAPPGVTAREAVRRIRELDPEGQYDFNHIYAESGDAAAPALAVAEGAAAGAGLRIGLVDTGLDARHPALAAARIEQRGFAPGGVRPQPHGLAVAALLVGSQGRFRGVAPGARLHVADVYGATPAGGSAASLVQAFGWMAQVRAPVINVSLVGPPNLALQAATRALVARGHLVVAAVGNDGPAAPPLYPAAYPGVVAVTAVDGRRKLLPEAGRPPRIDFAAPGADMAAPAAGGGFVGLRGASFAAPIVAGRLAQRLTDPDPAAAARARAAVAREAVDLGPRGRDRLYGDGLVGFELATRPTAVAARGLLTGH